jgi:hypothetical protein
VVGGIFNTNVPKDTIAQARGRDAGAGLRAWKTIRVMA